jgi:hypothetical protein
LHQTAKLAYPRYEQPDLDAVVAEEVVTQEDTGVVIEPKLPPTFSELAKQGNPDELIRVALTPIDADTVQVISECTKQLS